MSKEDDCPSFKEEGIESWKKGKNLKGLSNDIHWPIAWGKSELFSLVPYTLHEGGS